MFKSLQAKGAAMIVAGALGLIALGALGPVFAPTGASAGENGATSDRGLVRATAAQGQQSTSNLEERMRGMIEDHMGVTGEQADEWADDMAGMMESMHGDQADEMLEACASQDGGMMGDFNGSGMMGGSGGSGMMGGSGGSGMMGGSGGSF